MKKTAEDPKIKEARKKLAKLEEAILVLQEHFMDSLINFICAYYQNIGEMEILDHQILSFENLPLNEKKKLKKSLTRLYTDKKKVRRELLRFRELWWVKDKWRSHVEDYRLETPKTCSYDSTTACVPSFRFEEALRIILSRIFSLLHHFGFKVPEFQVKWKYPKNEKKERIFAIEVNLDQAAAGEMMKLQQAIARYDELLWQMDKLYQRKEQELEEKVLLERQRMWEDI